MALTAKEDLHESMTGTFVNLLKIVILNKRP
jgi:hypothetical protein